MGLDAVGPVRFVHRVQREYLQEQEQGQEQGQGQGLEVVALRLQEQRVQEWGQG